MLVYDDDDHYLKLCNVYIAIAMTCKMYLNVTAYRFLLLLINGIFLTLWVTWLIAEWRMLCCLHRQLSSKGAS